MGKSILPVAVWAVALILAMNTFGGGPTTHKTSGAWGESGAYQGLRGKGKTVEVQGNVLSSSELKGDKGTEPGFKILLGEPGRETEIHVGPRWFVLQNDLRFTRGEPLVVIGVSIPFGGKSVVVADEVRVKDRSVSLRDVASERPGK